MGIIKNLVLRYSLHCKSMQIEIFHPTGTLNISILLRSCMKYTFMSLLSLSGYFQASDAPKIPSIYVYTTVGFSAPYAIDVAQAVNLNRQAKKYDFQSSSKTIKQLHSHLVNAKDIATPEWDSACKKLNELTAQEKAVKNHLNLRECFKSAHNQATPLKLSLRTLGVAGFIVCVYKQARG